MTVAALPTLLKEKKLGRDNEKMCGWQTQWANWALNDPLIGEKIVGHDIVPPPMVDQSFSDMITNEYNSPALCLEAAVCKKRHLNATKYANEIAAARSQNKSTALVVAKPAAKSASSIVLDANNSAAQSAGSGPSIIDSFANLIPQSTGAVPILIDAFADHLVSRSGLAKELMLKRLEKPAFVKALITAITEGQDKLSIVENQLRVASEESNKNKQALRKEQGSNTALVQSLDSLKAENCRILNQNTELQSGSRALLQQHTKLMHENAGLVDENTMLRKEIEALKAKMDELASPPVAKTPTFGDAEAFYAPHMAQKPVLIDGKLSYPSIIPTNAPSIPANKPEFDKGQDSSAPQMADKRVFNNGQASYPAITSTGAPSIQTGNSEPVDHGFYRSLFYPSPSTSPSQVKSMFQPSSPAQAELARELAAFQGAVDADANNAGGV